MSAPLSREIHCVLIPAGSLRLLLPNSLIAEVIAQTPEVIARAGRDLPKGFPSRVAERIFAGLQEQANHLEGAS